MNAGLPTDIWWLLRVQVRRARDQVPFQAWLLWHHQFLLPKGSAT